MKFPNNKQFAFTIVDDTDYGKLDEIKPIYDLLSSLGLRTTKTVWPLEIKEGHFEFFGDTLENKDFLNYMQELKERGFEIALHGVSSGFNTRSDIKKGLRKFKSAFGTYPKMHINHAHNPDNIYWGFHRFSQPFKSILALLGHYGSSGQSKQSPFYWGDLHKKHITYTRNFSFNDINTIQKDPYMPYLDRKKIASSNYWFSCSDGGEINKALKLLSEDNVLELERVGGICILYVHFSHHFFVDGKINPEFEKKIRFLSERNGWFVPATELLDYLREKNYKKNQTISRWNLFKLNLRYFVSKLK